MPWLYRARLLYIFIVPASLALLSPSSMGPKINTTMAWNAFAFRLRPRISSLLLVLHEQFYVLLKVFKIFVVLLSEGLARTELSDFMCRLALLGDIAFGNRSTDMLGRAKEWERKLKFNAFTHPRSRNLDVFDIISPFSVGEFLSPPSAPCLPFAHTFLILMAEAIPAIYYISAATPAPASPLFGFWQLSLVNKFYFRNFFISSSPPFRPGT